MVGVEDMVKQLNPERGRLPGKLVFLSHDYNHLRPDLSTPQLSKTMKPGSEDLAMFIKGAASSGWTLGTLDTYLTD